MIYSSEVQRMCPVAKGAYHGPAPIPEEGKWVQAKEIKDISGLTHGIGWCAPQQGACKLTLNVLVLDQPTNHLDLESITAVNNGLVDFKGVVLFASHDHEFVQTIANRIMVLENGHLTDRLGTYEDYIASLVQV